MRNHWKLLIVLCMLLVLGGNAAAQRPDLPDPIVFWSSQGPVAVQRPRGIGRAQSDQNMGEYLLQRLLDGPTAEEAEDGLWTAIPHETTLAAVLEPLGNTVVVRLETSEAALENLTHDGFEAIVQQVGKTLMPLDWRDLRIQVRDPASGDFVALADFLPEIEVPTKPSTRPEAAVSAAGTDTGQPPAPGQGQPSGALNGMTVYVSAGHGWEWNSYKDQWKTQRPPYPNTSYAGPIIEDHNNGEAVNQYLLHYLWNAGAQVYPVRERDMNDEEAIVDDGGSGYSDSGWTPVGAGYLGDSREIATVNGAGTATTNWQASLPADGRYAVYVWYRSDGNRPPDARYTIHHAGGETTVEVDQRKHGYTWHYVGTFGFVAGTAARVTLTNQSSVAGRTVVADAVRFGGGTFDNLGGIDTIATGPPMRPWWEVASFYYTQKMGMAAGYGDVTVRPTYARWEHAGTGDNAVYVSWHSNGATGYAQWNYSGTETYAHNGEGLARTAGSLLLRDAIHWEVVHDIRAGWDGSWVDRGAKLANLGELRLLWDDNPATRMPGALIEIGFHDHPGDTDALKDPRFNQLVARALYQGIAKYFNVGATLLPEPPTHLSVENVGGGSVRVSWQPSPTDGEGLRGHAASGYRVYASPNGIGWSDGIQVGSGTEWVLSGLSVGDLIFVRVTATNAGGESFPTETLAVRVGDSAEILLVNGFDRINESMTVPENETAEGPNMRMFLDRMNSYDYVIQHGEGIREATTLAFDSASNEALRSGRINLNNYTIVDWILGEESTTHETLDGTERSLVQSFMASGGALFISGSEIGYHLDYRGADPTFYNNVLRADYEGDDAGTYQVCGSSADFEGLGSFRFDAAGMYDPDYPDRLDPTAGAAEALRYQGGYGGTAAVQYINPQNECERLVHFGFPFETITPDRRNAVMAAVLGFLDQCLNPEIDTSIHNPEYGSVHNVLPAVGGTANAQYVSLQGVEVQLQDAGTNQYWNGTSWVGSATWIAATGTEVWSYSLPASLTQGEFYVRARGRADGQMDATPAETLFTFDSVPPGGTSLITPIEGATVTALPELLLDWMDVEPDDGSDLHYRVELDGQETTTRHSYYTTTQVVDGPHNWRVRVEDAAGNASSWTDLEDFSVSRLHAWVPLIVRVPDGELPRCLDIIRNGGFEAGTAWVVNPPEGYDTYVYAPVHGGSRSARVGHDSAPYSSIRQQVALPATGSATLRLWHYPISEYNDPQDWQYIAVWDETGHTYYLEFVNSDARQWLHKEFNLDDFKGQRITIIIGATNDGDGNLTRAYVDDVEVEVCP